jgi:transposase-like protein
MKFIYIDATYFKVRENGKYQEQGTLCVHRHQSGEGREIFSARLYDSETGIKWESFFDDLKNRKEQNREKDLGLNEDEIAFSTLSQITRVQRRVLVMILYVQSQGNLWLR